MTSSTRQKIYVDQQHKWVALLGFGRAAEGHVLATAAHPRLTIRYVVEPSEIRRRAAEALIPRVRTLCSMEDLDAVEFDFLDICTPPSEHLSQLSYALNRGVLAVCEKPLVRDGQELHLLAELLGARRGSFYPCHNYLFSEGIQALYRFLAQNKRPAEHLDLQFRFLRRQPGRGAGGSPQAWRLDQSVSGGGVLQDLGPHCVYLAEHLVDSPMLAVRAEVERSSSQLVDVAAEVSLDFKAGSARFILDWTATRDTTCVEARAASLSAYLNEGQLRSRRGSDCLNEPVHNDFDEARHVATFGGMWEDLLLCLGSPSLLRKRQESAFTVVQVIEAAYRSAAEGGRRVDIRSESQIRGDKLSELSHDDT
jgi:predicted dehydrogenase